MALPSKSSAQFIYIICLPAELLHYLFSRGIPAINRSTGSTIVDKELSLEICRRNLNLIPTSLTIMRSRCIESHLDSWPCSRRGCAIIEVAIHILPVGSVIEVNILWINGLIFMYLGHSSAVCSVNIVAVVDKLHVSS